MSSEEGVSTFEVEFEIKCSAEKFFDIYADHVTMLPQVLPHMFRSTTVVKGDGKSVGSVVDWEYITEPPSFETARQTIEAIDEEKMVLTKRFYGGDLGKKFDLYRATLTAFKKDGKNYVKWCLDIKKTHGEIPEPHDYMDFIEKFTKEFDSSLATGNVSA
ncbi:MLP-like protein 423 isoform X2 [Telopea speciosissima]|uniref:MLP-like protein 423 isoform X2 n=1 Tax=Telopea speciosissima TaxID=54955 RepID=UPI001CC6CEFC|nr:MLP-like protein 423 isoform X2 [Telopea speciosissima]